MYTNTSITNKVDKGTTENVVGHPDTSLSVGKIQTPGIKDAYIPSLSCQGKFPCIRLNSCWDKHGVRTHE